MPSHAHRNELIAVVSVGSGLLRLATREGMKNELNNDREIPGSAMLPGLLERSEVQDLVAAAVTDITTTCFQGLRKLGIKYPNLRELDLSNSLAVLSTKDFAESQSSHGHTVMTQQPLPVTVDHLLSALYPASGPSLPRLTLMHIRVAKVGINLCLYACSASCASYKADQHAVHCCWHTYSVE